MLVVAANLNPMGARFPCQAIRNRITPMIAALRRVEIIAEHRVDGADEEDLRSALAGASVACRGAVAILPIPIREAQVIHYGRTQNAGHTEQVLIDPV